MISMGMGDDHEANRFPGGLLDFLENGFARRRIAPRVDRDDFVSQREPARVGALVGRHGPDTVRDLLNRSDLAALPGRGRGQRQHPEENPKTRETCHCIPFLLPDDRFRLASTSRLGPRFLRGGPA